MNSLDLQRIEDIRLSAYEIARNETADRGITNPEVTQFLAQYLVIFRDKWVSFDLDDLKEDELNNVIAAYFDE